MDPSVLIGLALGVLALIAQYRWPKVPRWITDLGLILSVCLLTLAFAPQINRVLPVIFAAQTQRNAADQQIIDSLQIQLATTKTQLATATEKAKKLVKSNGTPYTCMDGNRLIYIFNLVKKENSAQAEVDIKQAASTLDDCIKKSAMSDEELNHRLQQELKNGTF